MQTLEISQKDKELIEVARQTIKKYYKPDWHHVGAAVRTKNGKVFSAVHLEANVGRIAVCAEAIAIGKAISEGEPDFDTIVAVIHPSPDQSDQEIKVVSPCGMCRELISDYGSDISVILSQANQLIKTPVLELLPAKYNRGEG